MNFFPQSFLQTIIKASVADLIFSKIPCFQYFMLLTSILVNTFRRMRLKYEHYSLRLKLNAKYLMDTHLK